MKVISSADFLILCLVIADFDLEIGIEDLIDRVEVFQKEKRWMVGVSSSDFRSAWGRLAENFGMIKGLGDWERLSEILAGQALGDWIRPILSYNDLCCNDETEYWT